MQRFVIFFSALGGSISTRIFSSVLRVWVLFLLAYSPLCSPLLAENVIVPSATSITEVDSSGMQGAEISLLLSTKDDSYVYALFGHAAIRVKDLSRNMDFVYNYGVFDMSRPCFVFDFVSGHTDHYMVQRYEAEYYIKEYTYRGSDVYELHLNVPPSKAQEMFAFLEWNIRPENMCYRYNIAYDNCSTRLYKLLADHMGAQNIHLTAPARRWRTEIDAASDNFPWFKLGTDLALGSGADAEMTPVEQLFLPMLLLDIFARGQLSYTTEQGTDTRPLVRDRTVHKHQVEPEVAPKTNFFLLPSTLFFILLLLTIVVLFFCPVYCQAVFSSFLLLASALVGCILFFLAFFSLQPFTFPNVHLLLFHPLHLPVIPFMWPRLRNHRAGLWMCFIIFVLIVIHLLSTLLVSVQPLNSAILAVDGILLLIYFQPLLKNGFFFRKSN